jgi:carbon storage regulator CsrA
VIVLARRVGEAVVVGPGVTVTVQWVGESKVRFAIEAPPGVSVRRLEPETEEERKAE